MRVSNQQQHDFFVQQMQAAQARYVAAQKQVMTGKRFETPSEDPAASHTVNAALGLRNRTEQLDKNLRGAKDYLANTQSTFDELNDLVNKVNSIAVSGANSSYDQAARDAMAQQITEIQGRIVHLANTTGANGQYVFAGQMSSTKPFTLTPPNLTFNGDDNPIAVEVRPNETMRVNLPNAGTFFTTLHSTLETLKNDLLSGNLDSVGDNDIQAVQDQLRQINGLRGETGTKLQTVEALADQNQRRIDDLNLTISDVQNVDLTEAVTKMQSAQTAYTAALQVTALGQSLSLMDFMK